MGLTRSEQVLALVAAGHVDQVILSSNAIGLAKGLEDYDLPYGHVLDTFIPFLKTQGLSDQDALRLLEDNPRRLLTAR